MRAQLLLPVALMCLALLSVPAGCASPAPTTSTPTVDTSATAVTTVQAPSTATPATPTPAILTPTTPTLPMTPPATATPVTPVDPTTVAEGDLAVLIDEAVADAVAATQAGTGVAAQAAADGVITAEEVAAAVAYIYNAEQALAYADELINSYYALYGEYAEETLVVLSEINQEMESIAQDLSEIISLLEEGASAASAAVEQLNSATQNAAAAAEQAQASAEGWSQAVQQALDERASEALTIAPTEVASDRIGAIRQAYAYLDSVTAALADRRVSPDELAQIAQLGANASASLSAHGGSQLRGLSERVTGLTSLLARGQWPQALGSLDELSLSLPPRPRP